MFYWIKTAASICFILGCQALTYADYYVDSGTHKWASGVNWLDGSISGSMDVMFVGWMGSPELCKIESGDNVFARNVYLGAAINGITTTLEMMGGVSAIPNNYSDPGYSAAKNPCGTISENIGWNALFLEEGGWGGSGGFTYYLISNNIDNQNPLFIDEEHSIMALHDSSPAYTISGFFCVPWEKMGTLAKTKASRPILPIGWQAAPVLSKLYWAPALYAASHKVYFGTNSNPHLEASKRTFSDSSHSSQILQYNTTYYWCVDELDSQGNVLETSDIWNFKTISN